MSIKNLDPEIFLNYNQDIQVIEKSKKPKEFFIFLFSYFVDVL